MLTNPANMHRRNALSKFESRDGSLDREVCLWGRRLLFAERFDGLAFFPDIRIKLGGSPVPPFGT